MAEMAPEMGGAPDASSAITTQPQGDESAQDDLRHAIMLLQSAAEKNQDDDEFAANILKIAHQAQAILATEQKNQDSAMGITPQHKVIRQAMSGGGGAAPAQAGGGDY
jgi:hypothetical protein